MPVATSTTVIPATISTVVPATLSSTYGIWALVDYHIQRIGSTVPGTFTLRKGFLGADGITLFYSPVDLPVIISVPDVLNDAILSTALGKIVNSVQTYGSTNSLI